jgi:hypothetical protein
MSIVAFKKKSAVLYGSNVSGKPPGGYWLNRGPFGKNLNTFIPETTVGAAGYVGFSLVGGNRNVGYVGQSMAMSRNGTPFHGVNAFGSGGSGNKYYNRNHVYNVNRVIVLGDQSRFIKPSNVSAYWATHTKHRWINNGQYPNHWVQPNYTGNQIGSSSQGAYIQNVSNSNTCNVDVNNQDAYIGHIVNHGPTNCSTTTARYKFNDMVRNAPYTKNIRQPIDSSQYNAYMQKKCTVPRGKNKPFPFAVNGGCNTTNDTYVVPPPWYTSDKNNGAIEG